jgi:RNA polymerase sigma-70 factor, ECF subfamily
MSIPQASQTAPEVLPGEAQPNPDWSRLVEQIRAGEPSGMEELYRVFCAGIRFYLCRHLGPQDLDDRLHDVFLIIAQSIQRGELREPERLMGYVHTIVRRQVAAHIDSAVQARRNLADLDCGMNLSDHHPDPERRAIERQHEELAYRVLGSLPKRDREVLVRFYLREQEPAEICRDLELTETQFRLVKSRAKARFGELGRARLSRRKGFLFPF